MSKALTLEQIRKVASRDPSQLAALVFDLTSHILNLEAQVKDLDSKLRMAKVGQS
jgi:hypothetical protein